MSLRASNLLVFLTLSFHVLFISNIVESFSSDVKSQTGACLERFIKTK